MAQTKKRKKGKHRGTQGGHISHSRPRAKPQNRAEAAAQAEARRKRKAAGTKTRGPTWAGAVKKGLFAGVLFFVMMALLFGRGIGASLVLAVLMLIIYIPLSFQLDKIFHRRRLRTEELERIERAAQRKAEGAARRKGRSEPEPPEKRSLFGRLGRKERADAADGAGEEISDRQAAGESAAEEPIGDRIEDEPAERPRGKRAKAKAKPAEEPADDQAEEELTWEDAAAPPPKRSLFKSRR